MYTPPAARLHLLPALNEPIVVVLRRKPSKRFHILRWNTQTDQIEHGTWFEGKLFVERCDLSPDGQYLAYMAIGRDGKCWTGVANAPFLKTLHHYNQHGSYSGGGFFAPDGTLHWGVAPQEIVAAKSQSRAALALQADIAQLQQQLHHQLPQGRKQQAQHTEWRKKLNAKRRALHNLDPNTSVKLPFATAQQPYLNTQLLEARLQRDGWQRQGDMPQPTRHLHGWTVANDPGWLLQLTWDISLRCHYTGYLHNSGYSYRFSIDQHPALLDEHVTWCCTDSLGQLIVARSGRIEKYHTNDLSKPATTIDLNELAPPAATHKG